MQEKDFNTLLGHWVAKNKELFKSSLFEGKLCKLDKKKSIGVYDFEDHQLPLLRKVKTGVWYKFPDLGLTTPCDAMYLEGQGYVALYWYLPRKIKKCTLIKIEDFDRYFETVKKKSIRMEEAEDIALYCFDL